jgi:hypothetical protein
MPYIVEIGVNRIIRVGILLDQERSRPMDGGQAPEGDV